MSLGLEESKVGHTENHQEENEKEIFDIANHRRFSTRKRKNLDQVTYVQKKTSKKQKQPKRVRTAGEPREEIEFPIPPGTEIIINGKIKENPSFSGEVLVVQEYNSGNYKLEMANTCHGIWGNSIIRTEESLARNVSLVRSPRVPLIPIEFIVLNAVYDVRSPATVKKFPVASTLEGWRWVNSWERLTWTTQPLQLSYRHIHNLAKSAIVDNFTPLKGTTSTYRSLCILPPIKGSANLIKQYFLACQRNEGKYKCIFEYVWIYMD